uniref:Trafficking protein particle complex subunit n=1 Tax=Oryza meridionalis TaxID=40149 RepID=A0A0E0DNQ3_9ORYZ
MSPRRPMAKGPGGQQSSTNTSPTRRLSSLSKGKKKRKGEELDYSAPSGHSPIHATRSASRRHDRGERSSGRRPPLRRRVGKMIGVGKAKQYANVLDKPLSRGRQEVSLSAFAFLFSELVQYNQTQVDNIAELERRLEDAGYAVGARVLELLCHREKGNRRETRLLGILSFIHSTVWKVLFGKVADSLEKGTEHEDEYMISEKELLVNRFISVPKDMGAFNCGAFVAGIVRGVLENAGFPAVVTAHFVPIEGQQRPRTTILIKFAEEREARFG